MNIASLAKIFCALASPLLRLYSLHGYLNNASKIFNQSAPCRWSSLGVLCLLMMTTFPTHAAVLTLNQAQVIYERGASSSATPEHTIKLPDSWRTHQPAMAGLAKYRIAFDYDMEPNLQALYVPRVGSRYLILLNNEQIASSGDLSDVQASYVFVPLLVPIPKSLLRQKQNALEIIVSGEANRLAGLSTLMVGPLNEIEKLYRLRVNWIYGGTLIIVCLSIAMGLLALPFGVFFKSKPQITFGLAALCWTGKNIGVFIIHPIMPYMLWEWTISSFEGIGKVLLFACTMLTLRLWKPWMKWLLWATIIMIPLLELAHQFTNNLQWRQVVNFILLLEVLVFGGLVIQRWLRVKNLETSLLLLSAIAGIGLGTHDYILLKNATDSYSSISLSKFAIIFTMVAMSSILLRRAMRAIHVNKVLRRRFADKLTVTRAELTNIYARQSQEQAHKAQLEERLRIMRDMHDGVGSHLVGLLAMVNADQKSSSEEIEMQVRQVIEELRISIDSLQGIESDWLRVLGNLRDKIEPRLNHAGIQLKWKVTCAPFNQVAQPECVKHFRMLLLEVITNIIKHAHATEVTLSAVVVENNVSPYLSIRISDNGCGFDMQQQGGAGGGHGLQNLVHRAQLMGATLAMQSNESGTTVQINFNHDVQLLPPNIAN